MIAIIPARAGSKGLPGKNLKLLNGKPLIVYTIEAALKAKSISRVVVSTEDIQIANVAKLAGAEVPFLRPKNLALDESLAIDSYIFTVEKLKIKDSIIIEDIVILQPTSPLRLSDDIDEAIQMFISKKAKSVISFTKESHPIAWHKYIETDNRIISIFEEKLQNRQEERVTFYPNGAIYVFNYNFLKQQKFFSEKSYAFLMPRNRSIDIDYIEDFQYAEYLLKNKK